MLYVIAYFLAWVIFKVCNFWSVTGRENIPEGAAIFAANHTCWNDPVFLALAVGLKNRPQFMAKIEVTRSKVFGKLFAKLLKMLGVFFVDRKSASLVGIKHSMAVLRSGQKLVIFPEGTRVRQGAHVEPKGGAVMLAHRTGAPVVPVYITAGPKRVFTRVRVVIGKPMNFTFEGRPDAQTYETAAETLMERIFAQEKV